MDSVTQLALGAAVASACVPKQHRRKAVLIGAMLGTLPDLDVFIDYGDSVSNYTYHRGFSHSLFVLLPFSIFLWAILKKVYDPVRSAPTPWFFAITLTLVTHTLLDAHTIYGTQLFWPLASPPVMWGTIFIIDPLYTLPLLLGIILILIKPDKTWAARTLVIGLILSTSYLAWTWAAKLHVEQQVEASLGQDQADLRFVTMPTPFNSLLWRVVVLQDTHYSEGYYTFLAPEHSIEFETFPLNKPLYEKVADLWAAQRLAWFSQGFIKTERRDDYLVISDLRMGFEGHYVFNHAVAKVNPPQLEAIQSHKLMSEFGAEDLVFVWDILMQKLRH